MYVHAYIHTHIYICVCVFVCRVRGVYYMYNCQVYPYHKLLMYYAQVKIIVAHLIEKCTELVYRIQGCSKANWCATSYLCLSVFSCEISNYFMWFVNVNQLTIALKKI